MKKVEENAGGKHRKRTSAQSREALNRASRHEEQQQGRSLATREGRVAYLIYDREPTRPQL
jgi:hypothetical protein